jgi:uncharacterized protein (TIGR03435 family)
MRYLGATVVDRTGLKGVWDFTLEWTPFVQFNAASEPGGVSFFGAVEKQLTISSNPVPTEN